MTSYGLQDERVRREAASPRVSRRDGVRACAPRVYVRDHDFLLPAYVSKYQLKPIMLHFFNLRCDMT